MLQWPEQSRTEQKATSHMKTHTATDQKSLDSGLIKSSIQGDIDGVKAFLEDGANIHAQGDAALRCAAGYGHLDVVSVLLSYGADLDVGIKAAKDAENSSLLDLLSRIKLSREEKRNLLTEVPKPHLAAGGNRM